MDATLQGNKDNKTLLIVLIMFALVLGNALAGWFIANGLYRIRAADHYVSVKGIAERQVKADIAMWNLDYTLTGDDLMLLVEQGEQQKKIITDLLIKSGFSENELQGQRTEVIDQYAKEYPSNTKHRYIVNSGVSLQTNKIDLVEQAGKLTPEIIKQGIILINKRDYMPNPSYYFTKLDDIRPQMLEQATKSARLVAEQFAANSVSHIGDIRRASQGIFQILSNNSNGGQSYGEDTDQLGGINKIIRVVVSIDYELKKR